ncbi:MAG: hypothetical protein RQ885_08040 [Desulfurococcales archaeon]|jgi:hypothetical protein|nr:hypothetical protein [Desulfurococcales archaeon]
MRKGAAIAVVVISLLMLSALVYTAVNILKAQGPENPTVVQFYSPLPRSVVGVGGRFYIVAINIITSDPRLAAYPEVSINPTVRINATHLVAFTANYTARGPVDGVSIGAGPPVFGLGKNEALPGLVVIFNNTPAALGGPGRNLANLFQFTGFQDKLEFGGKTVYRFIQTVWIVGAPAWCGWTKAIAAIIGDRDGNGLLDDAPDSVPDVNGDGVVDERDLAALGVASNIASVVFYVPCPS